MKIELLLYLAGIVKPLNFLFSFLGSTLSVVGVVFTIVAANEENDKAMYIFERAAIFGLICLFLGALTPSKESVYLISALKISEDTRKTTQMDALMSKSYQYINMQLDELIKENNKTDKKETKEN